MAVLSVVFYTQVVCAQFIVTNVNAVWDDDFTQWEITCFGEEELDITGTLSLRWPLQRNWQEWIYQFEEYSGFIRTKWPGNLNEWELRGNNKVIAIRSRWRNDVNEWVTMEGDRRILVETEYTNNANVWMAEYRGQKMVIYTEYIDDPRDWIVEDNMRDVSVEQKIGMLFIALFQSIPK